MIFKRQAQIMQKQQPFRGTQCPNLLIHFHLILQVDYISGERYGIVNEGIRGNFEHIYMPKCIGLLLCDWLIRYLC